MLCASVNRRSAKTNSLGSINTVEGWFVAPLLVNPVFWYRDLRENNDVNWGMEAIFTVFVPFCWIFPLVEIVLLYFS